MATRRTIAIIGAGMGGLAAGIYGQLNGYQTHIFEMHRRPGGQCASWTRGGYTFDACIHHLFGCNEASRIYELWLELGAMPRDLVTVEECSAVSSPDGTLFRDYYDLERLEDHLLSLAPGDASPIRDYVAGIRACRRADIMGELMLGTPRSIGSMLPRMAPALKWFRPTMADLGQRFNDPFLRAAFPLLVYSLPQSPVILHLARHVYGMSGALRWPVGGAEKFVRSIEQRYRDLGGEVYYGQTVREILLEDDRAAGIRLEDGTEHRADIVISDADGRKTIMEMLRGRYTDTKIRHYCAAPPDETNWAVHVFLGVNRDLSQEPSALVMLLDRPVTLANHTTSSMEMQIYGFDQTMAPPGKGVIKFELVSSYSHWKALSRERARYDEEKQRLADQVIDLLESRFPGLREQVEVVDVPTILTWERFMGGTHGFANLPNRTPGMFASLLGRGQLNTLPGLDNFFLVGIWATSVGALFANALSGRTVLEKICRQDGHRFVSSDGPALADGG